MDSSMEKEMRVNLPHQIKLIYICINDTVSALNTRFKYTECSDWECVHFQARYEIN